MKHPLETTLLGLALSLLLTAFSVNAQPSKTPTSEVKYSYYYYTEEIHRQWYHRFLPTPLPEGLHYHTRMRATANIDDTPEKESIVLIVADTKQRAPFGTWLQAYLLITENAADGFPKKKAFFKLFDMETYGLEVPAKVSIELQSPPFIFKQPTDVSLRLVDLTDDGILDVWVEFGYAVAVISFQNGEFKNIFSAYTVPGALPDPAYIDLDDDGIYEIKIPYSIPIEGFPGAPYLPWMSLYEWDGTDYVLNNPRFYANNDTFLIRLLSQSNYQMLRHKRVRGLLAPYRFYLGLVHYYRGSMAPARWDLEWVATYAEKQDYIHAIDSCYSPVLFAIGHHWTC